MSRFRSHLQPTILDSVKALVNGNSCSKLTCFSKRSFCRNCKSKIFGRQRNDGAQGMRSVNKWVGSTIQARYFSERIDTTKDYYTILGIPKSSSKREIHNAFVKLAKEWHPDVHATKSEQEKDIAKQKFQIIQEAHSILGNESTRKRYDEMRANINMTFNQTDGQRQPRYRNRGADWERAFRQQMAAEWEHIRTEQQIHQAKSAFAHQSGSFSPRYTRNPLDMFGGPFHFGRYYYGSEASRLLPPLSMSQILFALLVGAVITHFGTVWFNHSRSNNNYTNNSRKNSQHGVDDDQTLWNELVEDEETNKRSRYSQYPQPSITLSPHHLQSQKLSNADELDNGGFSSQTQTGIHNQSKDTDMSLVDSGVVYDNVHQDAEKLR